ncbi:hypothetical protein L916_20985, partial [Phytophthora nicotianae]
RSSRSLILCTKTEQHKEAEEKKDVRSHTYSRNPGERDSSAEAEGFTTQETCRTKQNGSCGTAALVGGVDST